LAALENAADSGLIQRVLVIPINDSHGPLWFLTRPEIDALLATPAAIRGWDAAISPSADRSSNRFASSEITSMRQQDVSLFEEPCEYPRNPANEMHSTFLLTGLGIRRFKIAAIVLS